MDKEKVLSLLKDGKVDDFKTEMEKELMKGVKSEIDNVRKEIYTELGFRIEKSWRE